MNKDKVIEKMNKDEVIVNSCRDSLSAARRQASVARTIGCVSFTRQLEALCMSHVIDKGTMIHHNTQSIVTFYRKRQEVRRISHGLKNCVTIM